MNTCLLLIPIAIAVILTLLSVTLLAADRRVDEGIVDYATEGGPTL